MNKPSRRGKVDGVTVAIIAIGLALVLVAALVTGGYIMFRRVSMGIQESMEVTLQEAATQAATHAAVIELKPGEIPKDAEGLTETEMAELSRKIQAALTQADLLALATQPTTLPADPETEELIRRLRAQLERAAELDARLKKVLRTGTQPATGPATAGRAVTRPAASAPSLPTSPSGQPVFPLTPPNESTSKPVNQSTSGAGK